MVFLPQAFAEACCPEFPAPAAVVSPLPAPLEFPLLGFPGFLLEPPAFLLLVFQPDSPEFLLPGSPGFLPLEFLAFLPVSLDFLVLPLLESLHCLGFLLLLKFLLLESLPLESRRFLVFLLPESLLLESRRFLGFLLLGSLLPGSLLLVFLLPEFLLPESLLLESLLLVFLLLEFLLPVFLLLESLLLESLLLVSLLLEFLPLVSLLLVFLLLEFLPLGSLLLGSLLPGFLLRIIPVLLLSAPHPDRFPVRLPRHSQALPR